MERQGTKLGARVLKDKEMELILPNWRSIEEQIKVFRKNINKEEKQGEVQKINNIGIMGRRGAGKTSILRTFREKLEETNGKRESKDIILPIIIPENMSEGSRLMDVILGMFKNYIKKEVEKKNNDCIYQGRSKVEKNYNDLIKLYCYIKNDFRNILIQQFTTEQYYIEKSSEVFNSDTEFINKFNEFIDELVDSEKDNDSLIFLFIDDIDLSTTRCVEVVRTLLSYLSNQRIVTFISGDIETFEEGLTLDFLRQEQALDERVFQQKYFEDSTDENSLLERKKRLAYEYLKKIIPPAYRYSIKYWSEADRGNYLVDNDVEKKEDKKQLTLRELLCETVGKKVGENYFQYKVNGEELNFHYTYCMFDDTSRGLNNVYNVLQKLYYVSGLEDAEEKVKKERDIERNLIETIIDSKQFYSKYKEILLNEIIVFETDRVYVNLEKASELILSKKISDEKKDYVDCCNYKEQLSLFVLLDFSIRMFANHYLKSSEYDNLKAIVMTELAKNNGFEISVKDNKSNNKTVEEYALQYGFSEKYSFIPNFLLKGDFIFNSYFLMNYKIRNEVFIEISKKLSTKVFYNLAISLADIIEKLSGNSEEEEKELIINIYNIFKDEIDLLLESLSLDKEMVFGKQVLEEILPSGYQLESFVEYSNAINSYNSIVEGHVWKIKDDTMLPECYNLFWAKYYNKQTRYWLIYMSMREGKNVSKHILLDEIRKVLIQNGIIKLQSNMMNGFMSEFYVKNIDKRDYISLIENKKEKEWCALHQIDKNSLWNTDYCKNYVEQFLKKKIKFYWNMQNYNRTVFEGTELFEDNGAYQRFLDREKSKSICLADKLEKQLNVILKTSVMINNKIYLKLEQVMVIQCLLMDFINEHPRARYGKIQAKKLAICMKELPIVVKSEGNSEWEDAIKEIEKKEEEFFEKEFQERYKVIATKNDAWMKDVRETYFNVNNSETLDNLIKIKNKEHPVVEQINIEFIKYKILEKQILECENQLFVEEKLKEYERKMEKKVNMQQLQFCLHSYMKYLQMNNLDFLEVGKKASMIVKFAQLLIESGALAEQKQQSEMYELLSGELDLTEEEFETLFRG